MAGGIDADKQRYIFSKNLNYYMKRSGKNTADLAADLSFPFSTVSDWVHGKKYPRMDKVQIIADYFGVLKSNLTEEEPSPLPSNVRYLEPMKKVPLVGQIACGTPILAEENVTDYVDLPGHIRADFALMCKGDSMELAGIRDGDIVYIRKQESVENGQIAAVMVGGEEATLKRFYFDGEMLQLVAENRKYAPKVFTGEDINSVRVIGLAVAYTRIIE